MSKKSIMTPVMSRPVQSLLLAAGLLLSAVMPAQAASNDPLELTALMSVKAPKSMLLGVAQAGTRLVAVGERGIIVYSDNQGQSWTQASVPVSVTLTAVQFPTPECGWAVGHDGVVLNSVDGGKTWVKRFDGNKANVLMLAEAEKIAAEAHRVADAANGAAKAAALKTQEAADNAVSDVQASAKFGPSRPLLSVWFKTAAEGFVVGSYGQIFHTADGGVNWESLAGRMQNLEGLHYNAIASTAAGSLVIAGEGGKVYLSRDNGANWKSVDSGYKGQLYGVLGIEAAGSETLLAYGFGGHVVLGADDGKNWQELPVVSDKTLVGGTVAANGDILLTGQDGSILLSADHGHSFVKAQAGGDMEIASALLLANGMQFALPGIDGVHMVNLTNGGKLK